jgi:hypothetical protein
MARVFERRTMPNARYALYSALLLAAISFCGEATAEPYIAVATGFKCAQCHTSATGGGKRTAFGTIYAYNEVAKRTVSGGGDAGAWTGEVSRWLAIGADLRTGVDYEDTGELEERSELGISRAAVYAELRAIPSLLTLYIDQQIAPGGTLNREAYALLTPANGRYTIKAGKFFLPYGLRLQDDSAFIREATGVNFATPDNGIELGLERGHWSAQLALSNGTAGTADTDSGKQVSTTASYVASRWRVGASYNTNNADLGDRDMVSLFAGLRTGPIAWLAEVDRISDEIVGGELEAQVSLIEGNWRFAKGHNVKVSYEHYDPDRNRDADERERYSVVWEYSPIQLMQVRIGARDYERVRQIVPADRDEFFAELHVYF